MLTALFRRFSIVLILVTTYGCSLESENNIVETEEEFPYTLEGLDHGLIQSPINILTTQTSEQSDHNIQVIQVAPDRVTEIENTGHSVQLDFDQGTLISHNGVDYHFIQAHFHTPSEHQVDGITYPMEIHFVCMAETEKPQYLVAGAFFRMGEENPFIKSFIERIPGSSEHNEELKGQPVFIDDLLLNEEPFNDYYYYQGSLTTPPYTESVHWFIMKRVIVASYDQINLINEIEGNNARHVQALFGRTIEN